MAALFTLPVTSTALLSDAKFTMHSQRKCSLEYSYESEKDFSVVFEQIIFDGVESFKCTYYKSCSIEMIEAYDKVLKVENSTWLEEIIRNLSNAQADARNLKHLRIYFDDGPCYEFVCQSFEVISKKQDNYLKNLNNSI